jgi:cbb3-type cytochrome oxidase maturation protein
MSALYVMIAASLLIAGAFLAAFIWSVRKGHYDDDVTPSIRILLDEPSKTEKKNKKPIH